MSVSPGRVNRIGSPCPGLSGAMEAHDPDAPSNDRDVLVLAVAVLVLSRLEPGNSSGLGLETICAWRLLGVGNFLY
jgi:hypothetical protein